VGVERNLVAVIKMNKDQLKAQIFLVDSGWSSCSECVLISQSKASTFMIPLKDSFYERSCGAEGEDEVGIAGMADLDLHGPSKTISGEDLIGAEIFYPVSQQSKRSRGSEKAVSTELDAMQGSKLPAIATAIAFGRGKN